MTARPPFEGGVQPATALACARCGRSFVLVDGAQVPAPTRCTCGAELVPAELPSGAHELRRRNVACIPRASRPRAEGGAPPDPAKATDLGYGESHGYGPGHGGPTGPGDAPAPERSAPARPSSEDAVVPRRHDG